jgi:hypothetical protein
MILADDFGSFDLPVGPLSLVREALEPSWTCSALTAQTSPYLWFTGGRVTTVTALHSPSLWFEGVSVTMTLGRGP